MYLTFGFYFFNNSCLALSYVIIISCLFVLFTTASPFLVILFGFILLLTEIRSRPFFKVKVFKNLSPFFLELFHLCLITTILIVDNSLADYNIWIKVFLKNLQFLAILYILYIFFI